MMKFGMPSLTEADTLEQWAAICAEQNLQFVELNMNFPQCQLGAMNGKELARIADSFGIFFTAHLDDNMNVADFNPYVAEAYLKTTLETIALSKECGLKVLNMHLSRGAVYTLPERKLYFFEEYIQNYLDNMRRFRDACEEAIGDADIRICVENSNGYLPFMHKGLDVLLESPVFDLTYDIGHNHCAAGMDEPWILAHEDRLSHMHMHDARRDGQDHLALGSAEVDIPFYHALAKKNDCTVVLETKTLKALRESVAWLHAQGLFA